MEKKEVKEHILKKFSKDISTDCDGLCSLTNPSMLRISSSEALKCFDEKSHVQEIRERAPVLVSMVEAASVTKTKYKHDKILVLMFSVRSLWLFRRYLGQGVWQCPHKHTELLFYFGTVARKSK